MGKLFVKDSGTWRQVLQAWVKQNGSWRNLSSGLITTGGIGRQFFPDLVGSTTFSGVGSYSYTVPAGVSQLRITYPTTTGMVSTVVNVTPGTTYPVSIGDYGAGSSFGGLLSTSAYSTTVLSFSGNVDHQLYVTTGVSTVSGNSYSGTGDSTTLNAGAAAAGCFFEEATEGFHGDLTATINITTAIQSTIVNSIQTVVNKTAGRGSVTITQQPAASNSYRSIVYILDTAPSEDTYVWTLALQQIVSLNIVPVNANAISYQAPGTYSFTVPAGVTSLSVQAAGAGASGGTGWCCSGSCSGGGGGGGGGGAAISGVISVTPGQTLSVTVGTGGAAQSSASVNGLNGTETLITGSGVSISLGGGFGGLLGFNGSSGGLGGSGGTLNSLTGFTGTSAVGGNGGQANPGGGCVDGLPGSSTVFALGGLGGYTGYFSGGGGGGGASLGAGGIGSPGSPYGNTPGAGVRGGGGGGSGDEYSGSAAGGDGFVSFTW